MKAKQKKPSGFPAFYKNYYRGNLRFIVCLLLLIFLGIAVANVTPFLFGRIVDYTTVGDLDSLLVCIVLYFVATMFATGLGMLEGYLGTKFTFRITNRVRQDLFHKMLHMKCSGLDRYSAGELISRLNSDASTVVSFYLNMFTSILTILFNLAVALAFVFQISTELSLVAILFIPFSIASNFFFRKRFRALNELMKKFGDRNSTFEVNSVSHITGLRAYNLEQKTEQSFHAFIEEQWVLTKRQIRLSNQSSLVSGLIAILSTLTLIYVSAIFIMRGAFTIGGMVSFQSYMDKLTGAVSQLLSLNIQAQSVQISLERINGILDEESEPDELEATSELRHLQKLTVSGVSFRYTPKLPWVLKKVNLCIEGTGLFAIVGLNGSGKSSLLKLIMRHYEYDEGEIRVDDVSIRDLPLTQLRRQAAYIPKEVYIANESFSNNIRLGRLDATQEEVEQAAQLTGLDDFIRGLPDGYNSKPGENGKLLSSGQKQKLCMARAVLNGAPLLLFDEITSDLDGRAEGEIMDIIQRLAQTRIVLLVTHRIGSVMRGKRIFLLEDGIVTCEGTHDELLAQSGLYQEMFTQEQRKRNADKNGDSPFA